MGKKSHAPSYATATVDSDLFGSATAGKKGVTLNSTPWQASLSNTVTGYLNPTVNKMQNTLNSIISGDYLNDKNFKTYKANFNRQAADTFDTAVLGNLADRNLFGSSGMQALNDSYQNAMNNNLTNLMDNYYNRQVSNYGLLGNNLGSLLNTENTLYNWLMGVGQMAQNQAKNVSGYNLEKAKMENNNNLWGQLMSAGASLGGTALGGMLGGPAGAMAGNKIGGMLGGAASGSVGGGGNDLSIMSALQNAIPMTSFQSSIMG